jgi:hypothetical protein
MKLKVEKSQSCLEEIMKTLEVTKFHGNVTIHFTHGCPRKIEYRTVEDLHKVKS